CARTTWLVRRAPHRERARRPEKEREEPGGEEEARATHGSTQLDSPQERLKADESFGGVVARPSPSAKLLRDKSAITRLLILAQLEREPGITLSEVAARLDVTVQAVSAYAK